MMKGAHGNVGIKLINGIQIKYLHNDDSICKITSSIFFVFLLMTQSLGNEIIYSRCHWNNKDGQM